MFIIHITQLTLKHGGDTNTMEKITNKPGEKKKEMKRAIRHEILAVDYLKKALKTSINQTTKDYIKKAIREVNKL